MSASDADTGETGTLSYGLVNAAPAGLTFNADGSYTFDASSYDSLTQGQILTVTVPFTATDVNGASDQQNLVLTITGTNDAPVASAATAALDEDTTVAGTVSASRQGNRIMEMGLELLAGVELAPRRPGRPRSTVPVPPASRPGRRPSGRRPQDAHQKMGVFRPF